MNPTDTNSHESLKYFQLRHSLDQTDTENKYNYGNHAALKIYSPKSLLTYV